MTRKNHKFHPLLSVIAITGALYTAVGSSGACAAGVVVCPEKAAIQLPVVDGAVLGKARALALHNACLKAADELRLHLKLISGGMTRFFI
jgi:hypothetical protein